MNKESEDSVREKSLEILINKYQTDIEKLKAENERLKKYEKKFIGYLMILLSTIIFCIAIIIFISDFQFILVSFFSFALICFAIYLIFVYSPKTYHLTLVNSALNTVVMNLNQAISHFPLDKYTIFLPDREKVYQFIPFISVSSEKKVPSSKELNSNVFKIQDSGIVLEPIGGSLLEIIKNEFPIDEVVTDLNKMEILLQEILIDKLNLVKNLTFTKLDKGQYILLLNDNLFAKLCQLAKPDLKITTQLGCPICSFVAILLARITNRSILSKSCEYNQKENISKVIFELGEFYH